MPGNVMLEASLMFKKFKEKPDTKWNKEGGNLRPRPHPTNTTKGKGLRNCQSLNNGRLMKL